MNLRDINESIISLIEAPTHLLRLKHNKKKIMKGTVETIEAFLDDKDKSKYEVVSLEDLSEDNRLNELFGFSTKEKADKAEVKKALEELKTMSTIMPDKAFMVLQPIAKKGNVLARNLLKEMPQNHNAVKKLVIKYSK